MQVRCKCCTSVQGGRSLALPCITRAFDLNFRNTFVYKNIWYLGRETSTWHLEFATQRSGKAQSGEKFYVCLTNLQQTLQEARIVKFSSILQDHSPRDEVQVESV